MADVVTIGGEEPADGIGVQSDIRVDNRGLRYSKNGGACSSYAHPKSQFNK